MLFLFASFALFGLLVVTETSLFLLDMLSCYLLAQLFDTCWNLQEIYFLVGSITKKFIALVSFSKSFPGIPQHFV